MSTSKDGELEVAFSSEHPCERSFNGVAFTEVLVHSADAIQMRGKTLPMHREHRSEGGVQIGAVKDFRLDADGKTRGRPVFSRSRAGKEAKQDVEDGILTDASLRYQINAHEPMDDRGRVRITKWTPVHADLVGVGYDPTVGVNRSKPTSRSTQMSGNDQTASSSGAPDEKALIEKGRKLEAARRAGIEAHFQPYAGTEWGRSLRDELLADTAVSADTAGLKLLEVIGERSERDDSKGGGIMGAHSGATGGRTELHKFNEAATESLALRYGLLDKEQERSARTNEFNGWSLIELGRHFHERAYGSTRGMDRMRLAGALFQRAIDGGAAYQETSDFPAILENIAGKQLDRGWEEAPVTWDLWTVPGTAADYKNFTRPSLSGFGELPIVPENNEYGDRGRSEKKEGSVIQKRGTISSLTREAIINDDLSAFGETVRALGEAANRTVNNVLYRDVIVANVPMGEDTFPIFDEANHNNNKATGGPPNIDELEAMRARMARQTDNLGAGEGGPNPLNYQPRFIVCPTELGPQARQLVQATTDPRAFSGTGQFNSMSGALLVVEDVALSDAQVWYLMSNRSTVEVTGLQGRPAPTIERESGWSVDAVYWKVRIEFAVFPRDWRSMQRNPGA